MNILFICTEYPPTEPGGIGRFTSRLSEWLSSKGHHVVVAGWYKGINRQVYENKNGVEILRLPVIGGKLGGKVELLATRLNLRFFIEKIIRKKKIQLIEGPDYEGSLWLMPHQIPFVCRIHSSKVLLRRQEGGRLSRQEMIENWGAQKADYFVAVSKTAEMMAQRYWKSIKSKPIQVIPNPISDCFFSIESERGRKLPSCLVFSGSIASHKGVLELLQAWQIVCEKHPKIQLKLYGKSGNCSQILQNTIMESKDNIIWLGAVNEGDLCQAYKTASVGIFPSHFESEGMAAKEAAASGMPIVVSDIPSYREIFNDVPGVFYFEPKNIISLSNAILVAIDSINFINTDALVEKMQNHTMDCIGQVNEEFYQKVISQ